MMNFFIKTLLGGITFAWVLPLFLSGCVGNGGLTWKHRNALEDVNKISLKATTMENSNITLSEIEEGTRIIFEAFDINIVPEEEAQASIQIIVLDKTSIGVEYGEGTPFERTAVLATEAIVKGIFTIDLPGLPQYTKEFTGEKKPSDTVLAQRYLSTGKTLVLNRKQAEGGYRFKYAFWDGLYGELLPILIDNRGYQPFIALLEKEYTTGFNVRGLSLHGMNLLEKMPIDAQTSIFKDLLQSTSSIKLMNRSNNHIFRHSYSDRLGMLVSIIENKRQSDIKRACAVLNLIGIQPHKKIVQILKQHAKDESILVRNQVEFALKKYEETWLPRGITSCNEEYLSRT